MTLLSLGMAEEFRAAGLAVNCLWPRTLVATSAIEFAVPGGAALFARSRTPEIMADAAAEILRTSARRSDRSMPVGRRIFCAPRGVTDFTPYACDPANAGCLLPDLFL